MLKKKIKVLVIDDSALARDVISSGLAKDSGIEVVGTAADVYIARDKIVKLRPDVLTLDIEMPRMDGIEFLRYLMPQYPLPVIIVSSLSEQGKKITLEALEAGAVDFIQKPSSNIVRGLDAMLMELRTKIKIASNANVSHWKGKKEVPSKDKVKALSESTDKVIAIGASTGGTEAIRRIVAELPVNSPGVVIVQHMPPGFTKMFAESLNRISAMDVKEAENNDKITSGKVLIAAGNLHLKVIRSGGFYKVVCEEGEKVNGHCPSVNVMMTSVAQNVGANAIGVILTGMGNDGAKGLKLMKDAGAKTIAQDEKTSVVFGMPKVAYEIGAVEKMLPLEKITPYIISFLEKK